MEQPTNQFDIIPRDKLTYLEELLQLGLDEVVACKQAKIPLEDFNTLSQLFPEYYSTLISQQKKPIIEALKSVVKNLNDPDVARWYLTNRTDAFSMLKNGGKKEQEEQEKLESNESEETIVLREEYEAKLLAALSQKTQEEPTSINTPPLNEKL